MSWEEQWHDPETVAKWLRPSGWVAETCAKLSPPLRALDLGCGPGRHTVYFASRGYEAWGVELTQAGAELCRENLRRAGLPGSVVRGDMAHLPFREASFDLVVAYNVLYHTTRRGMREVIGGVRRILREGGLLLATLKSPEEWVYGIGEEIEPNTFLRPGKGLPIHFCREGEIPDLVAGFELLSKKYHARTKTIPGKGKRRLARWLLVLRKPGRSRAARPVPGPKDSTEKGRRERAPAAELEAVLCQVEDGKAMARRIAGAVGEGSFSACNFVPIWKKARLDQGRLEALLRPRAGEGPMVYVRWPEDPPAARARGRVGWDDGMLIQVFPEDDGLPGLRAALDAERIRGWLRSFGREAGGPLRARVLRYKPGKRCVIEYVNPGAPDGWVGKVYRGGLGLPIFRRWRALYEALAPSPPLPEPLGFDAEISLLLVTRVAGAALGAAKGPGRLEGFRRAGEILARLHALGPIRELPDRTLGEESRRLRAVAEKIASAAPPFEAKARALADSVAGGLASLPPRRTACHGEWDAGQLLYSESGAWMFDLDNVRNAHPALDLGSFLASLNRPPRREKEETGDAERPFLEGYRGGGGEVDPIALALFRATKSLRIALILARRRGSRWKDRVTRLLISPSPP